MKLNSLLTVTGICLLLATNASAAIISINFYGGGSQLDPGDVAGVVPVANWNNVNGTKSDLLDDSGAATSAAVTASGSNNYATATDPSLSANHKMMHGFGGSIAASTFTIEGLPASLTSPGYDVYVYFAGGPHTRTGTWTPGYTLGATTYHIRHTDVTWDGIFEQSTATTAADAIDEQDYVVFTGLNADSFTIDVSQGEAQRPGINGIQIVPIPEPASLALLAIGCLLVGKPRRR